MKTEIDFLIENIERDLGNDDDLWMTPDEMGYAQKIDWSDIDGNDISDEEKIEYFLSKPEMYEVNDEGLVKLRPEEMWFDDGYNSEIAYKNRWRDYNEEDDDDDDKEEYNSEIAYKNRWRDYKEEDNDVEDDW